MHLYSSVAHRTGSAEALELAEQLSAWHDDMVVHARAVARAGAARCDDACPHARAVELWRAAREILDESAEQLSFLKAAAAQPALPGSPPTRHAKTGKPLGLNA